MPEVEERAGGYGCAEDVGNKPLVRPSLPVVVYAEAQGARDMSKPSLRGFIQFVEVAGRVDGALQCLAPNGGAP